MFEGQLKRGPNPHDTYFDRVDLAPWLVEGDNSLAVLMWYYGRPSMSHNDSGRPALLMECDAGNVRLTTGDDWRAIVHPAYSDTGPPHPNWRLPESNIRFDARSDVPDWTAREFDDSAWPRAQTLGRPPAQPWGQLVERSTPLWRFSELRSYENEADLPETSDGTPIRARLPYNAQVTPYLEVEGPPGQVVDIRTDAYEIAGEPSVRAEYVTGTRRHGYESLGWMNGHEVIYSVPAGVRIHALRYRESGYDADFAGAFSCDDPFLNRLWQKAARTLYLEMRDGYVDCPDRERAQWWGDITIELQQAFYSLDRRADQLSRKAMLELVDWQRPDGVLFSPIPADKWDQELPLQILASVGHFGFWTYYLHTGDRDAIQRVYPSVRRYLALWQLDDDGVVIHRPGGWSWGDWGENVDMPVLENAWYYLALCGWRDMARELGETADATLAEERMEIVRRSFDRTFWNGGAYRSARHEGQTDDRSQALAVVAGLASPERLAQIAEVLAVEEHASPYMEKYVLEALFRMNRPEEALARMRRRYAAMVNSPLTTLWEGWGIGPAGFGGGSYNHAWSGGPQTLLSQYVAGVAPIEPGYVRYEVLPQMGELQQVRAVVPSARGFIEVDITRSDDRFQLQLESPPNTTATVGVPREYTGEVTLLGADGVPAALPHSAAGDRFTSYEIPPGRWTIVAARLP